jgi:hypothetical protein
MAKQLTSSGSWLLASFPLLSSPNHINGNTDYWHTEAKSRIRHSFAAEECDE